MRLIALKELPQGQQAGDLIETTDAIGEVLLRVGAARLAEAQEPTPARAPRGRYRRSDLRAEAPDVEES